MRQSHEFQCQIDFSLFGICYWELECVLPVFPKGSCFLNFTLDILKQ